MKKIVLILIVLILLCGCGKEKDNFEHYPLSDKDFVSYEYINDKGIKEVYALADITPSSHESVLTGLFYKVGEDDYILLETLESSTRNAYKEKYMYSFYDNKLYGVGNGDTASIFEIELNGKKSNIKELNLKYNDSTIIPSSIKSVDEEKISVNAFYFEGEHSSNGTFSCTLNTLDCSLFK